MVILLIYKVLTKSQVDKVDIQSKEQKNTQQNMLQNKVVHMTYSLFRQADYHCQTDHQYRRVEAKLYQLRYLQKSRFRLWDKDQGPVILIGHKHGTVTAATKRVVNTHNKRILARKYAIIIITCDVLPDKDDISTDKERNTGTIFQILYTGVIFTPSPSFGSLQLHARPKL